MTVDFKPLALACPSPSRTNPSDSMSMDVERQETLKSSLHHPISTK